MIAVGLIVLAACVALTLLVAAAIGSGAATPMRPSLDEKAESYEIPLRKGRTSTEDPIPYTLTVRGLNHDRAGESS